MCLSTRSYQSKYQAYVYVLQEFESFGIASATVHNDAQASESLEKLFVRMINATWNLMHKHRSLMRLHDQLTDSNSKTVNDNVNLKVSLRSQRIIINNIMKRVVILFHAAQKNGR